MSEKICVYAICKNEEKFIERWLNAIMPELDPENDYVVVLDTGSTDTTFAKLINASLRYDNLKTQCFDYKKEIGYFAFNKARNDSLSLVPFDADICVVFDLDQVPRKGWAELVRESYRNGFDEIHGYIIDHNDEGAELNRWASRNVHPNSRDWHWERIIHEGIVYTGKKDLKVEFNPNFIIDHYPDNKNKDRSIYKTLLEDACKQYPEDPYYGIYLGIELSRRYSKADALEAFKRCLKECDFTDNIEIHYHTYINAALCEENPRVSLNYLNKAKELGIESRRLYNIMANQYEKLDDTDNMLNCLLEAIEKVDKYSNDWRDDAKLFTGYIEDRIALIYYYKKKNYYKALAYGSLALELDPTNDRYKSNLEYYLRGIKDGK